MIRRSLIVLSLCTAVLCAFVGYLSHRAIEQSKKVASSSIDLACVQLMDKPPIEATEVVLSEFKIGKHFAKIDLDGDSNWDLVGVAVFPKEKQKQSYAYRAVILFCKGIPDETAYEEVFGDAELDKLVVDYWPSRQDLDKGVYAQLATNYRSLDFSKAPIAFYGYERTNPVFSETTKKASILVGGAAVAVAVITVVLSALFGAVGRLFRRKEKTVPPPVANRAGLPPGNQNSESTGGVLDRVRSMRDRQPGV